MAGIANPLTSFTDFISSFGGGDDTSSSGFGFNPQTLGGLGALLTSAGGLGLGGSYFGRQAQPVGYQGGIPDYRAVRQRVPNTYDPNRRPGSSGQRYFTDMQYVPKVEGEAPAIPMSAEGLAALNLSNPARRTISTPTQEMASASTVAPAAASSVINAMAVPTYTMESEFPAPVEEVKNMAAGGMASAQEQARKDAAALGITIDEYYALPFSERLGMAKQDIGELFNPSLGAARDLGTLATPKSPPIAPEITQPVPQPTTTANRPESLTLEDQMGINQGRMTTYPTGAGIGPEMRNEDFIAQLEAINKGRPETKITQEDLPKAPEVPPKPELKLSETTLSNDMNSPYRKRQKERREWDKKYGDKYNDDGTLKGDDKSLVGELLKKLGLALGGASVAATQNMAAGGLAGLKKGKYLNGATDGMADEIPATIDRTQPAALSDGEFVIPADVVSHLGNGNSDAGAEVLTDMMDKVRMARTGTKKQGKEIDPNKFIPKV